MSLELIDNFNVNQTQLTYDLNNSEVNMLLNNSLNKYHPILLYISSFFFIKTFILIKFCFDLNQLFSNNRIFKENYFTNILVFNLNFFALFLGSWWAFQEGT